MCQSVSHWLPLLSFPVNTGSVTWPQLVATEISDSMAGHSPLHPCLGVCSYVTVLLVLPLCLNVASQSTGTSILTE